VAPGLSEIDEAVVMLQALTEGSDTDLLVRRRDQYAGYWDLYPDGHLVGHLASGEESHRLPLALDSFNMIRYALRERGQVIPTPGGVMADSMEIANPEASVFVSDVLRTLEEADRGSGHTPTVEYAESAAKGGVISSIIVGVATSALYDLIRAAITRMRERADYDPDAKIAIGGKTTTIGELEQGPSEKSE
jgi:hypothetical protein